MKLLRHHLIWAAWLQIACASDAQLTDVLGETAAAVTDESSNTPGDILFQVLTPFIDHVIQPAIYADGIAGAGEPIRVMLVYDPDGSGVCQAATIARYLSINGQPVPREGSAFYRELRLDPLDLLDPQPLSVVAARSIVDFQPHFIIYQTQDAAVLRAVESGWPVGVPKPYFIVSAGFGAQLPGFVGADAALRKRAFAFLGLPRGDRSALAATACVSIDRAGNAIGLEPSGFVYNPATQHVDSALISCP